MPGGYEPDDPEPDDPEPDDPEPDDPEQDDPEPDDPEDPPVVLPLSAEDEELVSLELLLDVESPPLPLSFEGFLA